LELLRGVELFSSLVAMWPASEEIIAEVRSLEELVWRIVMPDLSNMMIHQIVYWAPLAVGNDGQVTFKSPVQLPCGRWTDQSETFIDKNGNTQVSRAKVRLTTDVVELGVLWKGKLADLESRTDPFLNPNAWGIRLYRKIYSRDGGEALRIAML